MRLDNTIIYLVGFAGAGKYTIARELISLTDAKLVDNHLINNPVLSVIRQDGITPIPEKVWKETRVIRKTVFKVIRTLSPADYSFIFTNELLEGHPQDRRLYHQVLKLSKVRKATFFPVRLLCNAVSLRQRRDKPDRRERLKSIDVSDIEWLLKNHEVLNIRHRNLLTLDVSDIAARRSAEIIAEHVRNLCPL